MTPEHKALVESARQRIGNWRNNSDKARVSTPLGELRALLAAIESLSAQGETEAGPVAWIGERDLQFIRVGHFREAKVFNYADEHRVPLYTHPAPAPVPDAVEAHPDDLAVDRFADAMKAKLAKKRAEGRGGWDNRDECSAEHLSYLLVQHIIKGDPLDVGNLAMMLHQRGDRIVIDDETRSIAAALASNMPVGDGYVPAAQECTTEGCDNPAMVHFIRGGIGSYYCHACYMRVQALAASGEPNRLALPNGFGRRPTA